MIAEDKRSITFKEEPRAEGYRVLLAEVGRTCATFSLVQREELGLESEAEALLAKLKPYLRQTREVSEWPGTRLLSGKAVLREYELSDASMAILSIAVGGLYEWQQPSRPEDLILWTSRGEPQLVTIAHERDGYVSLTAAEAKDLVERQPVLRNVIDAKGTS